MHFTKMHGLGNDFIIIEDINNNIKNKNELTRKLCDRHFGIGGDGAIFVEKTNAADIKMNIINSDGSTAQMCGNGIRCFGKYVYDNNIIKKEKITVETLAGIMIAEFKIEDGLAAGVKISMGKPEFEKKCIPFESSVDNLNYEINIDGKIFKASTVLMGVPHTVVFSGELTEDEVCKYGSYIEKLPIYPEKTNVNFVFDIKSNKIKVRTWERGAGLTLACGTGACATAVISQLLGKVDGNVHVVLPAGELLIEYINGYVYMEGPAAKVFEGDI